MILEAAITADEIAQVAVVVVVAVVAEVVVAKAVASRTQLPLTQASGGLRLTKTTTASGTATAS